MATGYEPIVSSGFWGKPEASGVWNEFQRLLDGARDAAKPADVDRALDVALRSAALETGAIEGLYHTSRGVTRTVALQGAAWETALDEIGPDVRGHFAAQLEALEHVLDIATGARVITETWIREVHAVTCREQATYVVTTGVGPQQHALQHGEYKTEPNHVVTPDGGQHFYCPPEAVSAEMARLVAELQTDEFATQSPVLQAAYSHHALTSIHPFADGNGRVARALASVFLYRAVGVPLVVFSDQQERYWDALEAADLGKPMHFVRFIEDRALDTMTMITDLLREAARPIADRVATVRSLFEAHGGITFAEVEACGQRLAERLKVEMNDLAVTIRPPDDVTYSVGHMHGKVTCDFGRPYHTLQQGGAFHFAMGCAAPVPSESQTTPIVGVADSKSERFAFIAIDANRPNSRPLLLRIEDLHPAVTDSAEARIRSWIAEALDNALADLQHGIEGGLRGQGFTP